MKPAFCPSTQILGLPGRLGIEQPALPGKEHALFYSGVIARLPLSSGAQFVLVAGGDARLRDADKNELSDCGAVGGRAALVAGLDDAALARCRWEAEPYFALLMVNAAAEIIRQQFLWPALYSVALRGLQEAGAAAQRTTELAEAAGERT